MRVGAINPSSFGIKFSEKDNIEMIEVRSHRDTLGNDDENRVNITRN